METFSFTGKVSSDGHLRLDIPTQLPEGEVSILVVVDSKGEAGVSGSLPINTGDSLKILVTTLPALIDEPISYPLQGKVIRYDDPTEPVAESDWNILK